MAVPMSFGLIMAGFAGHAVFPTIYRDMKSPKEYKKMVNYTYIVTAFVYMTVAASGYAMFGSETMQEVMQSIITVRYIYRVQIYDLTKFQLNIRLHKTWLQFQNIIKC